MGLHVKNKLIAGILGNIDMHTLRNEWEELWPPADLFLAACWGRGGIGCLLSTAFRELILIWNERSRPILFHGSFECLTVPKQDFPWLFPVDITLHQKVTIVLIITLTNLFCHQIRFLKTVFIWFLSRRCLLKLVAFPQISFSRWFFHSH